MKYFENPFILCPYCSNMCRKDIGFCCNNHKYLYEEKQIEILKQEGRFKYVNS